MEDGTNGVEHVTVPVDGIKGVSTGMEAVVSCTWEVRLGDWAIDIAGPVCNLWFRM